MNTCEKSETSPRAAHLFSLISLFSQGDDGEKGAGVDIDVTGAEAQLEALTDGKVS
jgi:hypothetical protein